MREQLKTDKAKLTDHETPTSRRRESLFLYFCVSLSGTSIDAEAMAADFDLEGDWDPDAHERMMNKMFNDKK